MLRNISKCSFAVQILTFVFRDILIISPQRVFLYSQHSLPVLLPHLGSAAIMDLSLPIQQPISLWCLRCSWLFQHQIAFCLPRLNAIMWKILTPKTEAITYNNLCIIVYKWKIIGEHVDKIPLHSDTFFSSSIFLTLCLRHRPCLDGAFDLLGLMSKFTEPSVCVCVFTLGARVHVRDFACVRMCACACCVEAEGVSVGTDGLWSALVWCSLPAKDQAKTVSALCTSFSPVWQN